MRLRDLPAGVYRHYKGHQYLVLGYAENSTNDGASGVMVVYVGLQLDGSPSPIRMRVREVEEFFGDVVNDEGVAMPRFTYMGPRVLA